MAELQLRKIVRDARLAPGRNAAMLIAIAVGAIAVGTTLGAFAILSREIRRSYLETNPASATFEIDRVDRALVDAVRAQEGVREVEARSTVLARAAVGDERRGLLLFAIDDFERVRIAHIYRERGAWPPPRGTMLIERTAVSVLRADVGDMVMVQTPHGEPRPVRISGVVHDPALAPAWMEQTGYAYISRETLADLGEPADFDELRVVFSGVRDRDSIDRRARPLARWLERSGHRVHEIRVPPPEAHPHERQMQSIVLMLAGFGAIGLVLGAILVANIFAARMASRAREIGIMKAIGARTAQIAGGTLASVFALGALAALIAVPVSRWAALALSQRVADMLNFDLRDASIPLWVPAVQAVSAAIVPLVLASIPIVRASRATVRDALDASGARAPSFGEGRFEALLSRARALGAGGSLAVRNAFRRRAWLAMTVLQLTFGTATFVTAIDLADAWEAWAEEVNVSRHYDVDVLLQRAESIDRVARVARSAADVRAIEAWGYGAVALQRGSAPIVRTYPDGGHGSFRMLAPPPDMQLVDLPVLEGRWLRERDTDAVVLNELAVLQSGAEVGDEIVLSNEGRARRWRVIGIVREVGSPATAFVSREAFGANARARLFRIAVRGEPRAAARSIEAALDSAGIGVELTIPKEILRTAVGDHVGILVVSLIAMALLMALVGLLGLASSTATQLIERTREIGVMRAIGATPLAIVRLIVAEGAVAAVLSVALGSFASFGLAALLGLVLGKLSFGTALPVTISPLAIAGWSALVLFASALAAGVPAWRATQNSVRTALAAT